MARCAIETVMLVLEIYQSQILYNTLLHCLRG